MKDYKRLTDRDECNMCDALMCAKYCKECDAQKNFMRLSELEDKIESGELCDREEVRKETAREILLLLGKGFDENTGKNFNNLPWYESFCRELKFRYGVELLGNSDKLEDEG